MSKDWIIITLDDIDYAWDGEKWFERKTFLRPSLVISQELNHLLSIKLSKQDLQQTESHELLKNMRIARDAGQFPRAETLGLRAKKLFPDDLSVAATLASVYRGWGKPQKALLETDRLLHKADAMLLTVRAAVLCDLNRYAQAKKVIARAYALSQDKHVKAVYSRIRAECPELFT